MTQDREIWYRDKRQLSIGGVRRYFVSFTRRKNATIQQVFLRIKNIENVGIRAIHLLSGPFILYCHVVPHAYSSSKRFSPVDREENTEIVFENQVKPGQSFNATLCMNSNSFMSTDDSTGDETFYWEIDVISQIFATSRTTVLYDFVLGTNKREMKTLHPQKFGLLPVLGKPVESQYDAQSFFAKSHVPGLLVKLLGESELWAKPPPRPNDPAHLVILTHGVLSNLTADMLYVKDAIESQSRDNVVVRGYLGNAGLTEKGITRIGSDLGQYIIKILDTNHQYSIDKISFVGHSLGGVVQLFAIKYILVVKGPQYFTGLGVRPWNLVCLATPFLGILNDMSYLISMFLDLGTLGQTGRDLTLLRKIPNLKSLIRKSERQAKESGWWKPLLEVLPEEPLQSFLAQFESLTLYANAVNDGIVPLRTGALLYLDWKALGDVSNIEHENDRSDVGNDTHEPTENTLTHRSSLVLGNLLSSSSSSPQQVSESSTAAEPHGGRMNSSKKKEGTTSLSFADLTNGGTSRKENKKHHRVLTRKEKRLKSISAPSSRRSTKVGADAASLHSDASDKHSTVSGSDHGSLSNIPPKASPFESAISTILCPVPSISFIMDPDCRQEVIFHDGFYTFDDLPGPDMNALLNWLTLLYRFFVYHHEWKLQKQAKIAKKYQYSNLTWRKVLVNLPPDAHNNIIVRRRFSNGYGWGVIDHLCESLFNGHREGESNNQDVDQESPQEFEKKDKEENEN